MPVCIIYAIVRPNCAEAIRYSLMRLADAENCPLVRATLLHLLQIDCQCAEKFHAGLHDAFVKIKVRVVQQCGAALLLIARAEPVKCGGELLGVVGKILCAHHRVRQLDLMVFADDVIHNRSCVIDHIIVVAQTQYASFDLNVTFRAGRVGDALCNALEMMM